MPNHVYTLAERIEIVRQREQGLSYRRIADHFAASYPARPIPSKATIRAIVDRFRQTGNLDPRLIKISYPSRALSEETKLDIFLAIEEDPTKPLSQIAEELGISRGSVFKVVRTHRPRRKPYNLKSHTKSHSPPPPPPPSPPPLPLPLPLLLPLPEPPSYNENEELIVPENIENMSFDGENQTSDIDLSSSPVHYSLWSYLKTRLCSEGRMEELDALWNQVANMINDLDGEIISKINLTLGITSLIKEEICSDIDPDDPKQSQVVEHILPTTI